MYRIGTFSKINKVTIKTLRYYDETGLLKPAFVDEDNGYRYYTSEQLPKLHRIIALVEVPVMIALVNSALFFKRKYFDESGMLVNYNNKGV